MWRPSIWFALSVHAYANKLSTPFFDFFDFFDFFIYTVPLHHCICWPMTVKFDKGRKKWCCMCGALRCVPPDYRKRSKRFYDRLSFLFFFMLFSFFVRRCHMLFESISHQVYFVRHCHFLRSIKRLTPFNNTPPPPLPPLPHLPISHYRWHF